jgi:hypothetical protein
LSPHIALVPQKIAKAAEQQDEACKVLGNPNLHWHAAALSFMIGTNFIEKWLLLCF